MEVILLERVEKLGSIGDVVTVKNGFARNFLLPRNKALRANEANRKLFEANKAKIVADNEVKRTEAEAASKGIDGVSVTLIRQASNTGQLYGSVAVRDIVEALVADGKKVGKQQIVLDKPIKAIGLYEVRLAPRGRVGHHQGERCPLAGRSRSAEPGCRCHGLDVRKGRRRVHRRFRPQCRTRHDCRRRHRSSCRCGRFGRRLIG